jgi:Na+/melibiose symporter-like transporter
MVGLSAAFMIVSCILYTRHYRLDEAEYERICGELAKGKLSAE